MTEQLPEYYLVPEGYRLIVLLNGEDDPGVAITGTEVENAASYTPIDHIRGRLVYVHTHDGLIRTFGDVAMVALVDRASDQAIKGVDIMPASLGRDWN